MSRNELLAPNENTTGSQKNRNVQAPSCYVRITEQMQDSHSGDTPRKTKADTAFTAKMEVQWPTWQSEGSWFLVPQVSDPP